MNKEIILMIILFLGLLGTLLPFLPGTILMLLAVIVYGFYDNWMHFSPLFVGIITLLTAFNIFLDYFAGIIGAKKFGATRKGTWGGIFGSLIGLFVFGPLGMIFGAVAGVIIGELFSGKNLEESIKISFGSLLGTAGGAIIKFITAIIIFVLVYSKLF